MLRITNTSIISIIENPRSRLFSNFFLFMSAPLSGYRANGHREREILQVIAAPSQLRGNGYQFDEAIGGTLTVPPDVVHGLPAGGTPRGVQHAVSSRRSSLKS